MRLFSLLIIVSVHFLIKFLSIKRVIFLFQKRTTFVFCGKEWERFCYCLQSSEFYFFRKNWCLRNALALFLVSPPGAKLCLGQVRVKNPFEAHAWVDYQGRIFPKIPKPYIVESICEFEKV